MTLDKATSTHPRSKIRAEARTPRRLQKDGKICKDGKNDGHDRRVMDGPCIPSHSQTEKIPVNPEPNSEKERNVKGKLTEESVYEVVSPLGEKGAAMLPAAPRLDTMNGKICKDGKNQGHDRRVMDGPFIPSHRLTEKFLQILNPISKRNKT